MKKFNIPLLLSSLYLIVAYPIAFWMHKEHVYYPGCSGMSCVVGNMMTALLMIILFLAFIIMNFLITTKIIRHYKPESITILARIHCLMISVLLILFWMN